MGGGCGGVKCVDVVGCGRLGRWLAACTISSVSDDLILGNTVGGSEKAEHVAQLVQCLPTL